jgi:hypothetical protein
MTARYRKRQEARELERELAGEADDTWELVGILTPNGFIHQPQYWSRCPNQPPCEHAAVLHAVQDAEDASPRCCADRCACGS